MDASTTGAGSMGAHTPEEEVARLRACFDASPFATLVFGTDLTIIDANEAHLAQTGLSRGEMVGRFLFDVFPKNPDSDGPDTEEVIRASVARVLETGAADETPIQRHDLPGKEGAFETHYWRMIHSPILVDGAAVAIRQDAWDVTGQVREAQLSEIQKQSASAIGDIAYWEYDPVTDGIVHSDLLEPMFGMDPGEADGRAKHFFDRIDPAERRRIERRVEALMDGPLSEPSQIEFPIHWQDGETRHMVLRGEASPGGSSGRVLVGTTIDVTQLRRHETELERALEVKEALLVEVNHRVKNSLQLVASILSIGARNEAERSVRQRLTSAAERVRAVASVHAQLYREDDVRRVDLGAQLPSFCAQLIDSLGAAEDGIAVELDVASVRVPTETAVALSLVVNELVTNSVKHAFAESRPERPVVRVTLEEPAGGKLLLSVVDNGKTGSSTEVDDVMGQTHAGTGRGGGLGMRLVTSLAAQLGADVTHETREGRAIRLSFDA